MKKYSKKHIDFIRSICFGRTVKEAASIFNKKYPTFEMTYKKMKSLFANYGIKNFYPKKGRSKYTKEQTDFLREIIPGHTDRLVCEEFNKKFNLNISEGILGNLKTKFKLKNGLVGGQFVKGQVSHNKGKKWDDFISKDKQKNSLTTCFKKGNLPHNRKEIGSERITKDGYIQVKVQDGKGNRNWELKQNIIYKQAHGEIPKGYHVSFADQNRTNYSLDNLILVSRAENLIMNRRGLYYTDTEITKSGHILAKLIDKQNKRRKK